MAGTGTHRFLRGDQQQGKLRWTCELCPAVASARNQPGCGPAGSLPGCGHRMTIAHSKCCGHCRHWLPGPLKSGRRGPPVTLAVPGPGSHIETGLPWGKTFASEASDVRTLSNKSQWAGTWGTDRALACPRMPTPHTAVSVVCQTLCEVPTASLLGNRGHTALLLRGAGARLGFTLS